MSKTSRWSYTNVATVWPFVKKDTLNGGAQYGEPFLIACSWIDQSTAAELNAPGSSQVVGREIVGKVVYYHEDPRVKYLDRIVSHDRSALDWRTAKAQEIIDHLEWDMSMLENRDAPDYQPDWKSTT